MARIFRRSTRKRSKRSIRNTVKNVVNSLAETKISQNLTVHTLGIDTYNKQITDEYHNPFGNLVIPPDTGVSNHGRIGNVIHVKGLKCIFSYDNSNDASSAPIYITSMVLLSYDEVGVQTQELYKGHNTAQDDNSGPPIRVDLVDDFIQWKSRIHTTPTNTTKYRVLHRSSIRLGCKVQPDLPGPRYAQRVVFIPMDKKVTFPKGQLGLGDAAATKPRLHVIHLVSNPTQVQGAVAPGSITTETVLYFKDL